MMLNCLERCGNYCTLQDTNYSESYGDRRD